MKTLLDALAYLVLVVAFIALWCVTPANADEARRGAEYAPETYAPPVPETPSYGCLRCGRALPPEPPIDYVGPRTCYTSFGYGTAVTTCY